MFLQYGFQLLRTDQRNLKFKFNFYSTNIVCFDIYFIFYMHAAILVSNLKAYLCPKDSTIWNTLFNRLILQSNPISSEVANHARVRYFEFLGPKKYLPVNQVHQPPWLSKAHSGIPGHLGQAVSSR